jgi:hypothetical protein
MAPGDDVPAPAPGRRRDDDAGVSRSDADESDLQRRDVELEPLVSGLTRRLKRALQDEHNDLLDRLRRVRGAPTLDGVLGPRDPQVERYVTVARPFLERAAAAGARFAAGTEAGDRGPAEPGAVAVSVAGPAADAVGAAIVGPLRERVQSVLDERGRDANEVIVDSLASVYREIRSQRVEPLAADALSAAHAEATWHTATEGSSLRWVAEDAEGPCPDCDDNVLAGPIPKGEVFPTGQLHPPAHQGCRCLLVPDGD